MIYHNETSLGIVRASLEGLTLQSEGLVFNPELELYTKASKVS